MLEPLQSALLMFAAAAYVRCLDSRRPWAWATAAGILAAAACTVKLTGSVLVVAMGQPRFVGRTFVKHGAVVIDVGTNIDVDGSMVGDVDAVAVDGLAGALTPVPGGVGPVTTAVLLRNTLAAVPAGPPDA